MKLMFKFGELLHLLMVWSSGLDNIRIRNNIPHGIVTGIPSLASLAGEATAQPRNPTIALLAFF